MGAIVIIVNLNKRGNMQITNIETALEKKEQSIHEILNWKVEQLKESKSLVESGLADYIAHGVKNIDNRVTELNNYKKLISEEINQLKDNKEHISKECALWLQEQGIDKLKGIECSSITISKGKEATTRSKANFEKYLYNGLEFTDIVELVKKLNEDDIVVFQYGEDIVEKIEATEDKIRINSKRS